VSLVAEVDEPGNVYHAQAISGPIELRDAALEFPYAGQTVTAQGTATPTRIRVGGAVMAGKLILSVPPVYPQAAKDEGVQGTVLLRALVGKDGAVQELNVLAGPAELAPAALEAVKQWQYSVTKLNGKPVEVETEVPVRFSLNTTDPEQ
jgi:TonB family protein